MMWLHEGFPNVHNDLKLKITVGNGNDKKSLPHGGISKIFFLDHFSLSFSIILGQKLYF